ncbi:hypothetical protein C8Q77DRAFT_1244585 [Trametes polyzona]|nr:hypothetical protein C8Q77DRAFT_1244585 [Trametes polyzona]
MHTRTFEPSAWKSRYEEPWPLQCSTYRISAAETRRAHVKAARLLGKPAEFFVFVRDSHAGEVAVVADGLEVTAAFSHWSWASSPFMSDWGRSQARSPTNTDWLSRLTHLKMLYSSTLRPAYSWRAFSTALKPPQSRGGPRRRWAVQADAVATAWTQRLVHAHEAVAGGAAVSGDRKGEAGAQGGGAAEEQHGYSWPGHGLEAGSGKRDVDGDWREGTEETGRNGSKGGRGDWAGEGLDCLGGDAIGSGQ